MVLDDGDVFRALVWELLMILFEVMAPHSQGRRLQGTEEREGRGKNTKVLSPGKVHK